MAQNKECIVETVKKIVHEDSGDTITIDIDWPLSLIRMEYDKTISLTLEQARLVSKALLEVCDAMEQEIERIN